MNENDADQDRFATQEITNPYELLDFEHRTNSAKDTFQVIQSQQEEQFELEFDKQNENDNGNKEALSLQ